MGANFFDKDLQESYDVIILGGGPAGCTAGMYAARDALSTLILERNMPGGNVAITELVENYPGIIEPIEGYKLSDQFLEHAEKFGAVCRQGNCIKVELDGDDKVLTLDDGRILRCKALIISTGSIAKKTGAKNEDKFIGRGVSFCATCDGGFFRNKEVIVVGGGDSALEEGMYLTKFASKVIIVHRRNEFRAAKIIQQRAKENEKIEFLTPYTIDEIIGDQIITSVKLRNKETDEVIERKIDGVFEFIGWNANTEIFKDIIELSDGGFIVAGEDTKTSVPGIFAAGDVRKKGLMQIVTAASDGAIAAKNAEHYINEDLKNK